MREFKMTAEIGDLTSNTDYRRILLYCGGIVTMSDFILSECGEYKEII